MVFHHSCIIPNLSRFTFVCLQQAEEEKESIEMEERITSPMRAKQAELAGCPNAHTLTEALSTVAADAISL